MKEVPRLQAVAVIPARGGSKGLPGKNIRPFCGKPLIAWTIEAARKAQTVARVVVSTDDPQIAAVSARFGAEVVWRPGELAHDTAPSEEALLHALRCLGIHEGVLVFLQCTSPLTLPEDIDATVALLKNADSAFTATPWHRFLWAETPEGVVPVGHDMTRRPMRQERKQQFLEVGAVYALKVEQFLRSRHRFTGRVALHPLPPERSLEIDDETDFLLAETLMRRRLQQEKRRLLPPRVQAVVMDFDGVLTDNRVTVGEDGRESVVCHRGDGWALKRLREAGIGLLVLTQEGNPAVARRCGKLGVPCIVARGSKLAPLREWLDQRGYDAACTLYVGNDVPDLPCMTYVGCGVAPADAHPAVRQAALVVLETPGGHGCLRELADMLFRDGEGLA